MSADATWSVSMLRYDVILTGFPSAPRVGGTAAEAIAQVFGIPPEHAERMVARTPIVVRSGVPEDVARKYFNAFAYIGATCEFRLTDETEPGGAVDARALRPPDVRPRDAGASPHAPDAIAPPSGSGPLGALAAPEDPASDAIAQDVQVPEQGWVSTPTGATGATAVGDANAGEPAVCDETMPEEGTTSISTTGEATRLGARSTGGDRHGALERTHLEPEVGGATGESPPVRVSHVARVRQAWEAGRDVSLSPADPPLAAPTSISANSMDFDGWEGWLDNDLSAADFPSGSVPVVDPSSGVRRGAEENDGTQIDAPHHSRLLSALDAHRRREALLARSGIRSGSDSAANLFGAPLGTPPQIPAVSGAARASSASTPTNQPPPAGPNRKA